MLIAGHDGTLDLDSPLDIPGMIDD
jgi:hypothetical protein